MNRAIVYMIRNLLDGRLYVGKTIMGLPNRIQGHLTQALREDSQHPLHCAIREQGLDNFEVILLVDLYGDDADYVGVVEAQFINVLGTTNPERGYNQMPALGTFLYPPKQAEPILARGLAEFYSGQSLDGEPLSRFLKDYMVKPSD